MSIFLKRVYDPIEAEDGKRVLVDRLWPRGITKDQASWDEWLKNAAPSPALRKWFAHQPDRFEPFRLHYEQELASIPETYEAVQRLKHYAESGNLTLLYAAKNESCNHAVILRDWLLKS